MSVDRKALVAHLAEWHPRVGVHRRRTLSLQVEHEKIRRLYRDVLFHEHGGPNTGPGGTPVGWSTGADAVQIR